MPRTERALKGWRKTTPTFQRLPMPWVGAAALIGWCLHAKEYVVATMIALGFAAYLRPGELEGLKGVNVVPPPMLANNQYQ
eukprot:4731766-Karenia_brevis.AAC.1